MAHPPWRAGLESEERFDQDGSKESRRRVQLLLSELTAAQARRPVWCPQALCHEPAQRHTRQPPTRSLPDSVGQRTHVVCWAQASLPDVIQTLGSLGSWRIVDLMLRPGRGLVYLAVAKRVLLSLADRLLLQKTGHDECCTHRSGTS